MNDLTIAIWIIAVANLGHFILYAFYVYQHNSMQSQTKKWTAEHYVLEEILQRSRIQNESMSKAILEHNLRVTQREAVNDTKTETD